MERAGYSRKQLKETAATFVEALVSAIKRRGHASSLGLLCMGLFSIF